jgi:hypothetical protein
MMICYLVFAIVHGQKHIKVAQIENAGELVSQEHSFN